MPYRLPRLMLALPLVLSPHLSHAEPGDETCFPLYQKAGAIPGTKACKLNASLASVGLGDYYCTASSGIARIERYCGGQLPPLPAPTQSKDAGPTCNGQGNPINAGTGNKYQVERDYTGTGLFPLVVERTYNSSAAAAPGASFGKYWRSQLDRSLVAVSGTVMAAHRHDGKILYFTLVGGAWTPDKDIVEKLAARAGGWTLTTAGDEVETYDAKGLLTSLKARNGQTHTFTRTGNAITRVADHFGRQLTLAWNSAGYLAAITDPDNKVISYAYDANGALVSVSYPDAAGARTRRYVYNETANTAGIAAPRLLTGIVDENGARYATFRYDSSGRGIGTEHAGGAERVTLAYGAGRTTVTDARNTARTWTFATVLGVARNTGVGQPGGAGCEAASSHLTYDANGNVASRSDFNGNRTTYTYDLARNLETSRTEAASSQTPRTVTTQWLPNYRLPAAIAEPLRITRFTYDAAGNLAARSIQPTTDATGAQGMAGAASGTPRTWQFTHDAAGQLLSVQGPRTDVNDLTRQAYDAKGNLVAITNAAGHVTTLSQHDAHGRPGRIVDANGMAATLQYNQRGQLVARTLAAAGGSELTQYTYDAAGQLTRVAFPDKSFLQYTHDGAHRLTGIADSLGNRIAYTLDASGNRIREQVQDPGGALARQITRAYDPLNRLQQVTGGAQ